MRQVFISGASSDIGLEVCKIYLQNDFRVVAHYNTGQTAFFDLVESDPNITPVQMDFSDPQSLTREIDNHRDIIEKSDVLVSASALYEPAAFSEITAESILHAMSVNLVPGLLLTQAMIPNMIERGWGRIVHLGSIGVKFGGGSSSFCYALSKHAAEFLPSDHKNWAAHNVLVNVLRVGVTDTRMHARNPDKNMADRVAKIPAGRMARPDEIAHWAYRFGSDENTHVTGQTIAVAGGE